MRLLLAPFLNATTALAPLSAPGISHASPSHPREEPNMPELYDDVTYRDLDDGIYRAQYPDAECDRCHLDSAHYELADDEPGEWTYCLPCARKLARAALARKGE